MTVKALVMRTAGTNCDMETSFALRKAGAETQSIHINQLRKNPGQLLKSDILLIPGGFSYGDDLGAGTLLGNELLAHLKTPLSDFIDSGKLIIGICNGFQVLVKTGLLPAINRWEREVTLAANDSHKFEDRWVHLKAAPNRSKVVMEDDLLYLPVAHAEGKLICRDGDTLLQLKENGQILFRYCDSGGKTGAYPINPNGSAESIAGICDPTGRVIGMMPHPERHCLPFQHPQWRRQGLRSAPDGALIFSRAVECARERRS